MHLSYAVFDVGTVKCEVPQAPLRYSHQIDLSRQIGLLLSFYSALAILLLVVTRRQRCL
jgi:hypothetical protein